MIRWIRNRWVLLKLRLAVLTWNRYARRHDEFEAGRRAIRWLRRDTERRRRGSRWIPRDRD